MPEMQERLQNALKNIENTLAGNAAKDFNESMRKINDSNANPDQFYDPKDLDAQISSYQDLFDRLKFLFLEQEAKEKFLRMVLEANPKIVAKADIEQAIKERDEMSVELEARNKEVEDLTNKVEEIAVDNYNKYTQIMEMDKRLTEKIESLQLKNEQLSQTKVNFEKIKQSDPSLPKFQEIFKKIPSLSSNVDESVLNSIEEMQKLIDQHLAKIHELQQQLLNSEKALAQEHLRIQTEKQKFEELTKQDKELSKQIETIKQIIENEKTQDNPDRVKMNRNEESLKILNKVWLQISNIQNFQYDDDQGMIKFEFKDYAKRECLLNVDAASQKISRLRYDGINETDLKEISTISNKSNNPVSHVIQLLYNLLSKK